MIKVRLRRDGSYESDITALQYRAIVEDFFYKNPYPTANELKNALVPIGVTRNTATVSRRFRAGDIFKYEFWSSDSQLIMVKYHKPNPYDVLKRPTCNSACGWTAQILAGYCEFFGWNSSTKEYSYFRVDAIQALAGKAPCENLAHIPIRH